jgi:hypothetical protein
LGEGERKKEEGGRRKEKGGQRAALHVKVELSAFGVLSFFPPPSSFLLFYSQLLIPKS